MSKPWHAAGMKLLSLVLVVVLFSGCSSLTPAQQSAITGIADIAIGAAAAHFGVPASDTTAITAAANSLWGMAAQAQAGQPAAQGASAPAIGAAIAPAIPPGTPDQLAATLQLAAVAAKAGLK